MTKIMLAGLFFIIISALLFEKNEEKKLRLNYKILFPLIAAL
jgi:hypothetical protein